MSKIEWCDRQWKPIRGCSPVGEGCDHCWAARVAHRQEYPLPGFTCPATGAWTGLVELVPDHMEDPLHWRNPRRIAVGLMGDWMHPNLPDSARDRILAVEALCSQHTFIHLTKRWERQSRYFMGVVANQGDCQECFPRHYPSRGLPEWPLPNVIIGNSGWDQASTDEACRWLLQTPAATRLLCLEPLLAQVRLTGKHTHCAVHDFESGWCTGPCPHRRNLDWVIVGGETGPGARRCDIAWIRSIVQQCAAAGVPCFVKQLGSRSVRVDETDDIRGAVRKHILWLDHRGADPAEWPVDLRVRQFPEVKPRSHTERQA